LQTIRSMPRLGLYRRVTRSPWAVFVMRRFMAMVGLLVLLSFGIFSLLYLAPGSMVDKLLGTRTATPQTIAQLKVQYHLDQPFLVQYWIWLKGAVRLDLGRSASTGLPVTSSIRDALGVTLFLGLYAFLLITLFGLTLGIVSAVRKRRFVDRGLVVGSVVGASMPAFVTGILLLYFFSVRLTWLPTYGAGEGFVNRFVHLTLPAVALALTITAVIHKLTRASLIEALEHDYVAFARARGLPRHTVVITYGLRNAIIPVTTYLGLLLASLVTGAVFIEVVFSLPGLGSLLVSAVQNKDIPLVQGVSLLAAAFILLANLGTDILYLFIDPRIRFEHGTP
jgi:peptide/nickel transport system permease protein